MQYPKRPYYHRENAQERAARLTPIDELMVKQSEGKSLTKAEKERVKKEAERRRKTKNNKK